VTFHTSSVTLKIEAAHFTELAFHYHVQLLDCQRGHSEATQFTPEVTLVHDRLQMSCKPATMADIFGGFPQDIQESIEMVHQRGA
jgi:hypothetical protein